ncbi:unnamed protein product [Calypogeia fissa]
MTFQEDVNRLQSEPHLSDHNATFEKNSHHGDHASHLKDDHHTQLESPSSQSSYAKVKEQFRDDDVDHAIYFRGDDSRSAHSSDVNSDHLSPSEDRFAFRTISSVAKDLEEQNAFDASSRIENELYLEDTEPQAGITLAEDDDKNIKYADKRNTAESDTDSESDEEFDGIASELVESRSSPPPPTVLHTSSTELRETTIIDEETIIVDSDEKTFDRLLQQAASSSPGSILSESSSGGTVVPARSKTRRSMFVRPVLKKSLVVGSETEKILAQGRSEENQQPRSATTITQKLDIKSRDDEKGVRRSSSIGGLPGQSRSRNSLFVRPVLKKSLVADAETEQTFSRLRSEQPHETDQADSLNVDDRSGEAPVVPATRSRNSLFIRPVLKKSLVADSDSEKLFERLKFEQIAGQNALQSEAQEDTRSDVGFSNETPTIMPTRPRKSLFTRTVLKTSLLADSHTEKVFARLKTEQNETQEDTRSEAGDSSETPIMPSVRPRKSLFTRPVLKRSLVADSATEQLFARLKPERNARQNEAEAETRSEGEDSYETAIMPTRARKSLFTRPVLKKSLVADSENEKLFARLQSEQNARQNEAEEDTRSEGEDSNEPPIISPRARKSLFTRPVLKKSLVANSENDKHFARLQSEQTSRQGGGISHSASFESLAEGEASSSASPTTSDGSDGSSVPASRPRKSLFTRPVLKQSLVADTETTKLFSPPQSEQNEQSESTRSSEQGGATRSGAFEGLLFGSRSSPLTSSDGSDEGSVPQTRSRKSLFTRPVLKRSLMASDSATKTLFTQLQSEQTELQKNTKRLQNEADEDTKSEGGDSSETPIIPTRPRKSLFTRPVLKQSLVADSETKTLFTQLQADQTQLAKNTKSTQNVEKSVLETISRSARFEDLLKTSPSSSATTNSESSSSDVSSIPVIRTRESLFQRPILKKSLVTDSASETLFARLQSEQNEAERDTRSEKPLGYTKEEESSGLSSASRTAPSTSLTERTDTSGANVPARQRKSLFTRPVLKQSLVADSATTTSFAQLQSEQIPVNNKGGREDADSNNSKEELSKQSFAEGEGESPPPGEFPPQGGPRVRKSSLKRSSLSISSDPSVAQNESPRKRVKFNANPEGDA